MSYDGISIKEAISKINSDNGGWFLPAIQRPYVWGSRYESEQYICKLFDSIFRGYPIGGLILWNTAEKIAYREFVGNFENGIVPKLVEEGQYGRSDKWLVYDGQQRMQTLYSCLKYTFNDKILIFNLLFDFKNKQDPQDTPFAFVEKNIKFSSHYLKMNELFIKQIGDKTNFRMNLISELKLSLEEKIIIENNIDKLWDVFVSNNNKSLAFFKIQSTDEDEVNEIFERLNSGGMALSLSDLLFSKIKGEKTSNSSYYDFEEKLQLASKSIFSATGNGYSFGAYNILQLLNLIVKGRVRVDPKVVKPDELLSFPSVWEDLKKPMNDFFIQYLWGQFKINNASIIPRKITLLPIMLYFYEIYKKGFEFKNFEQINLIKINQYFIKSQVNDWSLQSYIDNFAKIIIDISNENKESLFDFPLEKIEKKIEETKQRSIVISTERFASYLWFSLKILTPARIYHFDPDIQGRFNPEIDHIFPRKLVNMGDEYKKEVDVIWNMQPVGGDINGYKLNHHPKEFFSDNLVDSKNQNIIGSKYLKDYDFMPTLKSSDWDNYSILIENRKNLMKKYMKDVYKLIIE
jgi:uncharacterized protein with ParB-like and HNH nuclease domain